MSEKTVFREKRKHLRTIFKKLQELLGFLEAKYKVRSSGSFFAQNYTCSFTKKVGVTFIQVLNG